MLGQRVRELREAKGWSQEELARRVGLNPKTIYNYEAGARGVKEPPLSTVKALANALNVTLEELLAEPENGAEPAKVAG